MRMRATVLLGLLFALALAPISLAQAVIAGGLVFLTVLADRLFISRREVFDEPLTDDAGGVTLRVVAFGLVIVAATMTPPPAATERR